MAAILVHKRIGVGGVGDGELMSGAGGGQGAEGGK